MITATEHYGAVINRNFDYVRYLVEAADKRQTLSRCFLLFRELEHIPLNPHSPCKPLPGEYVAPFLRAGPGYATDGYPRFDLFQWDPEYFERLHGFLSEAARRNVIVELTLFSNTYSPLVWNLNPFNVVNNTNGIGDIAWQSYNSMRDDALFERQMAYVRKVVAEVNHHDNFYFEVCNEPFGDHPGHASVAEVEAWQAAIREVILEEEARLPKQHLIFQVPTERWRSDWPLEHLTDEPTVDGITLHDYNKLTYKGAYLPQLARFMQRDLNLDRINFLWTTVHDTGKPFVFDEDNSCTNGLDVESWTIHRKRAWSVVCSGGHYDMIDFSIQAAGGEAGTPASRAQIRTWLKHLSSFIHTTDFVHATPIRGFCSGLPQGALASTLANAGREYVIYLADRRELEEPGAGEPIHGDVVFALPRGSYQVHFYSPTDGQYFGPHAYVDGGDVRMNVGPFVQDLVIHITADQ
jgi:hypothetical protein